MPLELHIVSVGNSLIGHYAGRLEAPARPGMRDEGFWARLLENPAELDKVYAFLEADPAARSAEVRSLEFYLRAHGRRPSDVALYLIGTRTASNEIVRTTLTRYFKTLGHEIYMPSGVPGYFGSPEVPAGERPVDAFRRGMVELLHHLIDVAHQAQRTYRAVVFNATGGFKAHVIVVALAAFITGSPVYYVHEEFDDLIEFPALFYLPTAQELAFLKDHRTGPFSVTDCPDDCLRRWLDFGLVEWVPGDATGTLLRLTPRARALLKRMGDNTPSEALL
ncbi:hypothetical protein HRbin11_02167 [bacterium HR11]|nr:hypothetical protein HRbin11_02167 [bacterium HR11]